MTEEKVKEIVTTVLDTAIGEEWFWSDRASRVIEILSQKIVDELIIGIKNPENFRFKDFQTMYDTLTQEAHKQETEEYWANKDKNKNDSEQ